MCRSNIKWLSGFAGLLLPGLLLASNLGFLRYGVIADFTEGDIQQLMQEYPPVLKNHAPGKIHNWKNPRSGHGGEIMVIRQYKYQGNMCKRLKFLTRAGKQSSVSYFNFCLRDGKWQLSENQAQRVRE